VEGQDQRTGLADPQAAAYLDAGPLETLDLLEQLGGRQHHAVADIAAHPGAHDAAGYQVQCRLDTVDDQCMAGVVAPLEAHHPLGAFSQPIHQLALALITPLGAYDNDVASLGCFHRVLSNGFHDPLPRNL